jgi:hypothetical protein
MVKVKLPHECHSLTFTVEYMGYLWKKLNCPMSLTQWPLKQDTRVNGSYHNASKARSMITWLRITKNVWGTTSVSIQRIQGPYYNHNQMNSYHILSQNRLTSPDHKDTKNILKNVPSVRLRTLLWFAFSSNCLSISRCSSLKLWTVSSSSTIYIFTKEIRRLTSTFNFYMLCHKKKYRVWQGGVTYLGWV